MDKWFIIIHDHTPQKKSYTGHLQQPQAASSAGQFTKKYRLKKPHQYSHENGNKNARPRHNLGQRVQNEFTDAVQHSDILYVFIFTVLLHILQSSILDAGNEEYCMTYLPRPRQRYLNWQL